MRWRSRRYVFAITQFRGVLYLPASDETVLVSWSNKSMCGDWCSPQPVSYVQQILHCEVKGNLCIDPLLGNKMVLPFASIKARKQGKCNDLGYGIDVVRTTTRPMKTPGAWQVGTVASEDCVNVLNGIHRIKKKKHTHTHTQDALLASAGLSYFVLAMLQLRAACVEDEQQRRDVQEKLEGSGEVRVFRVPLSPFVVTTMLSLPLLDLAGTAGRDSRFQQDFLS